MTQFTKIYKSTPSAIAGLKAREVFVAIVPFGNQEKQKACTIAFSIRFREIITTFLHDLLDEMDFTIERADQFDFYRRRKLEGISAEEMQLAFADMEIKN